MSERRFNTPVNGSVCARRSASVSAIRWPRKRSATPSAVSTAAATIASGMPEYKSASPVSPSESSSWMVVAMLKISSSSQASRNQPAARLPCLQALKQIHSVKAAALRNSRLPNALTAFSYPKSLAKLASVRTMNATANQPNAE